VLLEEVDADAEGVRRLALREREATERGADRLLAPVLDRAARGGHATTSRGTSDSPPRGRTVIRALGKSWGSPHPDHAVLSGFERLSDHPGAQVSS
jgi:hypothetical protein